MVGDTYPSPLSVRYGVELLLAAAEANVEGAMTELEVDRLPKEKLDEMLQVQGGVIQL